MASPRPLGPHLGPRQREILIYLRDHPASTKYGRTSADLGRHLARLAGREHDSYRDTNTARDCIRSLQLRGLVNSMMTTTGRGGEARIWDLTTAGRERLEP